MKKRSFLRRNLLPYENPITVEDVQKAEEFFRMAFEKGPAPEIIKENKEFVEPAKGIDAYLDFFRRGIDFYGTSNREEFWIPTLTHLVLKGLFIWLIWLNIDPTFGLSAFGSFISYVFGIIQLVLFLPELTLTVRRLHDIDYSGWFLLLPGVPSLFLGMILLFKWFAAIRIFAFFAFGVTGFIYLTIFVMLLSKTEPNRFDGSIDFVKDEKKQ